MLRWTVSIVIFLLLGAVGYFLFLHDGKGEKGRPPPGFEPDLPEMVPPEDDGDDEHSGAGRRPPSARFEYEIDKKGLTADRRRRIEKLSEERDRKLMKIWRDTKLTEQEKQKLAKELNDEYLNRMKAAVNEKD